MAAWKSFEQDHRTLPSVKGYGDMTVRRIGYRQAAPEHVPVDQLDPRRSRCELTGCRMHCQTE